MTLNLEETFHRKESQTLSGAKNPRERLLQIGIRMEWRTPVEGMMTFLCWKACESSVSDKMLVSYTQV